jgi:LysM repeat protein
MTGLKKYALSFLLFACAVIADAQQKSSNIQTIDGKQYYIHQIEKKQSLYAISKLYNVTVDELYRVNPDLKAGAKAGQEIRIPLVTAAPPKETMTVQQPDTAKFIVHKVEKGETVYSITRRFSLSEKQLLACNPGLEAGLREGQLLVVGEKKKRFFAPKDQKDNRQTITVREKALPDKVDSSLFLPFNKPAKTQYNVALMLPFQLNHALGLDLTALVKSNASFPMLPSLAVDFYLGFRQAVDSLASPDFSVNLQLYDVDERDSSKLTKLVAAPAFSSLDMVFGPLHVSGFKTLSKKAAEMRIPMVSPLTQQNKILFNNIYISKTNPSQFTLLETLADYCIDSLMKTKANVILMTMMEKDRRESAYVQAFKQYFNDKVTGLGRQADTVRPARGMEGLKAVYMPDVKNIVVCLSGNQVMIADFTTQLAMFADKKDMMLCGWESVTGMDNIDQEYLNQLRFTFPHQFNVTNLAAYKSLSHYYKSKQEALPSEYYFIGYDIAYYYLKHLKEQGPDFIYKLDTFPMETRYMRFRYSRPDQMTGFDNRGVFIFRYDSYEVKKTGW